MVSLALEDNGFTMAQRSQSVVVTARELSVSLCFYFGLEPPPQPLSPRAPVYLRKRGGKVTSRAEKGQNNRWQTKLSSDKMNLGHAGKGEFQLSYT